MVSDEPSAGGFEPGSRRDFAGVIGWGVFLAIAAAILLARLFGGGC